MIERTEEGFRVLHPMVVANARALLEAGRVSLLDWPERSSAKIDLSAVSAADSSALAVIFGLQRTANERGIQAFLRHPPASLISLAALYGVSDLLSLA